MAPKGFECQAEGVFFQSLAVPYQKGETLVLSLETGKSCSLTNRMQEGFTTCLPLGVLLNEMKHSCCKEAQVTRESVCLYSGQQPSPGSQRTACTDCQIQDSGGLWRNLVPVFQALALLSRNNPPWWWLKEDWEAQISEKGKAFSCL